MAHRPPSGLGRCAFKVGCSVVDVDSLFHVSPIVHGNSVFGLCLCMHYILFFSVDISLREKDHPTYKC